MISFLLISTLTWPLTSTPLRPPEEAIHSSSFVLPSINMNAGVRLSPFLMCRQAGLAGIAAAVPAGIRDCGVRGVDRYENTHSTKYGACYSPFIALSFASGF